MGRYYNGDIEGKFWVAVQPSNAADQFGVEGIAPEYLDYNFYEEDIPAVKYGIKKIEDRRLDFKKVQRVLQFYGGINGITKMNVDRSGDYRAKRFVTTLTWPLVKKILKHLVENGDCHFTAEC
jgi:hypothetical protein